MITKDAIESAYAFFHQKERIYRFSTLPWQRDDIEYAIEDYVDRMDPELYRQLSNGRTDFLRCHSSFEEDISSALTLLESLL